MASFPEIRFHRWALPEIRFYWGMDQISNTRMMVSHHIVLRERLIQLKEGESLNAYNSIKIIPIRRELTVLFWNIFSPPTTLCLHRVIVMQKQWYAVVLVMMILIGVISLWLYGIWSLPPGKGQPAQEGVSTTLKRGRALLRVVETFIRNFGDCIIKVMWKPSSGG